MRYFIQSIVPLCFVVAMAVPTFSIAEGHEALLAEAYAAGYRKGVEDCRTGQIETCPGTSFFSAPGGFPVGGTTFQMPMFEFNVPLPGQLGAQNASLLGRAISYYDPESGGWYTVSKLPDVSPELLELVNLGLVQPDPANGLLFWGSDAASIGRASARLIANPDSGEAISRELSTPQFRLNFEQQLRIENGMQIIEMIQR